MHRPVTYATLLTGLLVLAGFSFSCVPKRPVKLEPANREALIRRALVLPVTGVSEEESRAITRVISESFKDQGYYELIPYQQGQFPDFDRLLTLARSVGGTVPLDRMPELGKATHVDAVIVTHQSTITPTPGVAYQFESETSAIIKSRQKVRVPRPTDPQESSGFSPVSVPFPSGLLRMQMLEIPSGQRLWEAQKAVETYKQLKKLIAMIPAPGRNQK